MRAEDTGRAFGDYKRGAALSATLAVDTPFTFQRIDHIVLRCRDTQKMLDLGGAGMGLHGRLPQPSQDREQLDRPARLRGAGRLARRRPEADAPRPEIDPTKGSLDHFAINLAPYDAEAVTEYLTEKAPYAPYAHSRRPVQTPSQTSRRRGD